MCPLYNHMETFNIIIMNERRKFHFLITPHSYSPYINCTTPLCLPCTPSNDYPHLYVDYVNSSTNCTDFSIDCANKFYDCANTLDD